VAGDPQEQLKQKYERNGWPAQKRPDVRPVAGWSIPLLASISRPRGHALSPDGSQIAFFYDQAETSDLYTLPLSGGWPARLTFDREPFPFWADDPPQWSPDGQWLAYTAAGHVWVIPARGGRPEKVSHFAEGGGSPRWLPDSHQLLVTVSRDERSRVLLTDRQGAWPRAVSDGPGHDQNALPSPDGRYVVYVHRPLDDFNRSDIHLADLQTGQVSHLTGLPGYHDFRPRWSPDGTRIGFLSERTGFHELFILEVESGAEWQLTTARQDIEEYAWSPDGSRILAAINRAGAFDLALVDPTSGAVEELRTGDGVHDRLHWLPDGRSVTFEYQDAQTVPDIYHFDLDSGQARRLTFSQPPALDAVEQAIPERVSYASFDGLEIPAFLYKPANPNGAAVVHPHGGPTSQYILEYDVVAQYFVAKGYTWLAVNFRGSTGYGIDFERANHGVWGVDDTKDCLGGADYLAALNGIDRERIAIFGASYGSYMAVCSLAYDPEYRFACGVAKYGDCDILSSWAQGDQDGREDLERQMKHPARNQAGYRAGSPVWQAASIQKPLFIAHGLLDDRVHPLQSEELVEALRREDRVFEYVTYPDEGHGFLKRRNKIDFYTRLERFLDWYLL
jgi:dipeptidyl aminopeptidase/acylaminoacyl peptidase